MIFELKRSIFIEFKKYIHLNNIPYYIFQWDYNIYNSMKFYTMFNIVFIKFHKTILYKAIEKENIEIVRLLQSSINLDINIQNI